VGVVAAGMAMITAFYLWVPLTISTTLAYPEIAAQMVLFGLGFGLTSAPATESIMDAVSARQAGIGSAVNDATRLLGGTLGVAIIGSVAASVYSGRLASTLPPGLPPAAADAAGESLGLAVARHLADTGQSPLASALQDAASTAFTHAISVGCYVSVAVAAAATLLALIYLPAQPPAELAISSPTTDDPIDGLATVLALPGGVAH